MKPSRITRRNLMLSGAAAVASTAIARGTAAMQTTSIAVAKPSRDGADFLPVTTPNGATLPYRLVDGVKVFHLTAGEFDHEFVPGLVARAWGYNGRTPGPTIEAVEGDRVRIYVTNTLPEPTTIHWHGVVVPSGMDGVSGLSQAGIPPGQTFKYEFPLVNAGTHMYHSHYDEMIQIAMGMVGMFIIHPRDPRPEHHVDRDFALMLGEWRVEAGARRTDPTEMIEFNVLTMNSRAFPGTDPLVVRTGQRVRVRIGNLGPMDHHPIHLHGYEFRITENDGGRIPENVQWPANTLLVPVGETRALEFVARNPGDWAFHCHMTHHTMNQMGHAKPSMLGVLPGRADAEIRSLLPGYMSMGTRGMGEMGKMKMPVPPNSVPMLGTEGRHGYIDMGGMFTVVKVRDGITSYDDPGWYQNPPGTVASRASEQDLRRDGIELRGAGTMPAAIYTCPMHPEVVSPEPGECPKCGMRLLVQK